MAAEKQRGEEVVRQYSAAMLHQLNLNAGKGEWKKRPIEDGLWQIVYHFAKLVFAVKPQNTDEINPIRVQEFAADVGNETMILADALGTLEQAFTSKEHQLESGSAMQLTDDLVEVLTKWGLLPPGFEAPVPSAGREEADNVALTIAAIITEPA